MQVTDFIIFLVVKVHTEVTQQMTDNTKAINEQHGGNLGFFKHNMYHDIIRKI